MKGYVQGGDLVNCLGVSHACESEILHEPKGCHWFIRGGIDDQGFLLGGGHTLGVFGLHGEEMKGLLRLAAVIVGPAVGKGEGHLGVGVDQ